MPIAFAMAAVGRTLGILIPPSAILTTPPVGMNVFVLRGVLRDVPLTTIFRGVLPFWVADIFRLALLIVVPGLSLWLVSVM